MHNCIFSAHCTENSCDISCPILAETTYLLERNNISMDSHVFNKDPYFINKTLKTLEQSKGALTTVISPGNTVETSELLTYCAICQNWQGSKLHCKVYNLRLSKYIEAIKNSWSKRSEPEKLEYMKIWSESADVLIISHIDFVIFKDFESQTLLNLIQSRQGCNKTTIVVSPKISTLGGDGKFFATLQSILSKAVKS